MYNEVVWHKYSQEQPPVGAMLIERYSREDSTFYWALLSDLVVGKCEGGEE